VEFGAGSCALTLEAAPRAAHAVEIADQVPAAAVRPANFELVLYDGFHLDLPADSVDLVFSNQFVEHLHPDDATHHFETVHRILRPGGRYVLTTPERWTGPHDVSRWFSDTPQGFHLREWSYRDLVDTTRAIGFEPATTWWTARGRWVRLPVATTLATEAVVARMSLGLRRRLGHRLLPLVVLALVKRAR
jgi:SAM-dependent methyltransferase